MNWQVIEAAPTGWALEWDKEADRYRYSRCPATFASETQCRRARDAMWEREKARSHRHTMEETKELRHKDD